MKIWIPVLVIAYALFAFGLVVVLLNRKGTEEDTSFRRKQALGKETVKADYKNVDTSFYDRIIKPMLDKINNTERYGEFGDASGYLSPGLKERTISIDREDEHSYGYVLLQMLTVDGAEPTLISSRVLCVPPLTGDPLLEFDMTDSFMPSVGEEFTFVIMHRYPCEMSVVVEDAQEQVIRRLASRQATRPEHLRPLGSTWCWTGRLADGSFAPPGQYRIRATAHIGGENYTLTSGWFELTGEEVFE